MLDHLLWAVPELRSGIEDLAARSGVEATPGGRHPGVGTHNALLSLGETCYLEVIAPDPTQGALTGLGRHLEGLAAPRLLTWCARTDDIERTAADARQAGLAPGPIIAMSRQRTDGVLLSWKILEIGGHPFGRLFPFFIDWGESEHPALGAAKGCRLTAFEIGSPRAGQLRPLLQACGLTQEVCLGTTEHMTARLDTPRGMLSLAGSVS